MAQDPDTYQVLGIDPGLGITGYALIGLCERSKPSIIEAGTIRAGSRKDNPAKIEHIYVELTNIINEYKPDCMAIEKLYSHYAHPQTAITMGHARGVIILAAQQASMRIKEIPATKVKKAVTGNGHASKEQVQQAVQNIFKLKERPSPFDVSDAIAIAVCAGRNI